MDKRAGGYGRDSGRRSLDPLLYGEFNESNGER